ncbi:DUF6660 family protein [Chitinophaga alhagiae]|uniref:DUF6660 family protein n=1 Tax=Chitinophaga alhagiae TaxID=2203219 RepID=UPI000E5C56FD|nr:DUF6660 family protein [Chitinophaga alhagiae]
MKAWSFLLSIWMLACAGLPCADRCTDADHEPAQEEVHVPLKETRDSGDLCSPFCVCSCCAVISVLPKNAAFLNKPVILNAPVSRYLIPPVQEVADSFWQPPRFA